MTEFDCEANAQNCTKCNIPTPEEGQCYYSSSNGVGTELNGNVPCLKGVPFIVDGQEFVCPSEIQNGQFYNRCNFTPKSAFIPYLIGAGIALAVFVIILLIVLKVKKVI